MINTPDSTPISVNLTERMAAVNRRLLEVYGYPDWGNLLPPLDELVSTILSQNTNDANRDRAYCTLRERFPTWESVRVDAWHEIALFPVAPTI